MTELYSRPLACSVDKAFQFSSVIVTAGLQMDNIDRLLAALLFSFVYKFPSIYF